MMRNHCTGQRNESIAATYLTCLLQLHNKQIHKQETQYYQLAS